MNLEVRFDWNAGTWMLIGEGFEEMCPALLTDKAPDEWVLKLVRDTFQLEPTDILMVNREIRF